MAGRICLWSLESIHHAAFPGRNKAAAAFGWADYKPAMADEEILRRLLALNRERKATENANPESKI